MPFLQKSLAKFALLASASLGRAKKGPFLIRWFSRPLAGLFKFQGQGKRERRSKVRFARKLHGIGRGENGSNGQKIKSTNFLLKLIGFFKTLLGGGWGGVKLFVLYCLLIVHSYVQ